MDRITTVAENDENVIVLNNSTPGIWHIEMHNYSTYMIYGFAADRLAAYEDTGLSPEEVAALKADNENLHRLVDAAQKILWSSDTEEEE